MEMIASLFSIFPRFCIATLIFSSSAAELACMEQLLLAGAKLCREIGIGAVEQFKEPANRDGIVYLRAMHERRLVANDFESLCSKCG